MNVLVTGAAGFLGTLLIKTLLSETNAGGHDVRIVAADLTRGPIDDTRVEWHAGSITDTAFIDSIAGADLDVVFHLAAVLSGQAEAEFDLGLRVNVDATRALLEACRRLKRAPRFVFSSTIAVFGGPLPEVVPEDFALMPQSSYGAEKAIAELLVLEYSRRGFVDAVVCRVPTVTVRPGKPNSALSSFVSGIIREPIAGLESLCPVPLDTPIWVSSPATVTYNLLHASRIPASALEGRRAINLPGLSVTPGEMLDSLQRLAGPAARALVRCEVDDRVQRIFRTWPGAFEVTRALALGFRGDTDVDAIVCEYMTGT